MAFPGHADAMAFPGHAVYCLRSGWTLPRWRSVVRIDERLHPWSP